MTERDVAKKTIFTYAEAAALLPEVRELTEEAYLKVEALGPKADDRVQRIVVAWAETMIAKGARDAGIEVPTVSVPTLNVPEQNRAIVKPHTAALKAWLPLAFLGM